MMRAGGFFKVIILLLMLLALTTRVFADSNVSELTCKGRFVNPISDVCWSCIMPISIGPINIGLGSTPSSRDRANPESPICGCIKNNLPIPGISVGFWEPLRLVDVTRTPYCMVNLGGILMGSDDKKISDFSDDRGGRGAQSSFYHLHYYVYPLIYWLELLTDFACLEASSFDVAYMSEFDVTWNDQKLQSLLNPEAILFANPLAQSSCALDCAASTINMGLEPMFWCAGCWGNLYPFLGANAQFIGGVQNASLLTYRILAKMHRLGLAQDSSTNDGSFNGPLCAKRIALTIKKSQYKLQMTSPKASSGDYGCWPLGLSDLLYSSGNEYPYNGQDWGYLVWRKKNCCLF